MTILYVDFMDVIMGGGGSLSSEEYVAKLDGSNKYWQFNTPISLNSVNSSKVFLDIILDTNTTQVIYGSGSSPERLYIGTENGNWLIGNGTDRVDTLVPANVGVVHNTVLKLEGGIFTFTVGGVIVYQQPIKYSTDKSLTGISDLSGFRLLGGVFNFKVEKDGIVTNSLLLTDKNQGATQNPIIGSISATMVGYQGDEWVLL